MTACSECGQVVEPGAAACPRCRAAAPALAARTGVGYEWRSGATLFGLPLIHVAIGWDPSGRVRVARGIVAVGQVACGVITIAQFGVGLLTVAQFGAGLLTVAQFGAGLLTIAQFGVGLFYGAGRFMPAPAALAALATLAFCLPGEGLPARRGPREPGGGPAGASSGRFRRARRLR